MALDAIVVVLAVVLGLVTGFVRGAVVVAVFVLLGQFVQLTQTSWWRGSRLMPYASEAAGWLQSFAETGMGVLEKQADGAELKPYHAHRLHPRSTGRHLARLRPARGTPSSTPRPASRAPPYRW